MIACWRHSPHNIIVHNISNTGDCDHQGYSWSFDDPLMVICKRNVSLP